MDFGILDSYEIKRCILAMKLACGWAKVDASGIFARMQQPQFIIHPFETGLHFVCISILRMSFAMRSCAFRQCANIVALAMCLGRIILLWLNGELTLVAKTIWSVMEFEFGEWVCIRNWNEYEICMFTRMFSGVLGILHVNGDFLSQKKTRMTKCNGSTFCT